VILDTNAISALSEGNPNILGALRSSRTHSIPVIVIGEFKFGLQNSRQRIALAQWLSALEGQMEILSIDKSTADCYAEVMNELRQADKPIPSNDIWIAALARQHGLSILSRDTHFDNVTGIVRTSW